MSFTDNTRVAEMLSGHIYVSGPMTGVEDHNYPLFNAVSKRLRENGGVVNNPAESFYGDQTRDREDYLRRDLEMLLLSDSILFLPGWEDSEGAMLEARIASELRLNPFVLTGEEGIVPLDRSDLFFIINPQRSAEWHAVQDKFEAAIVLPEESILTEAARLTANDRQEAYGPPFTDFSKTVGMWNALFAKKLTADLTPYDFCLAMMAIKMSRLEATPGHRDSLVDIAGYANCYSMMTHDDG